MTALSTSAPATCDLQLWDVSGPVLVTCQLAAEPSYAGITRALECFATEAALHPRSAIVMICVVGEQRRIVHVRDAGYAFSGRERSTINMLIHAAWLADTASAEADHLAPRPASFQRHWFGADSDAANVACAALVDRVVISTQGSALDRYEAFALYREEVDILESQHAEVGDSHVCEAMWSELARRDWPGIQALSM